MPRRRGGWRRRPAARAGCSAWTPPEASRSSACSPRTSRTTAPTRRSSTDAHPRCSRRSLRCRSGWLLALDATAHANTAVKAIGSGGPALALVAAPQLLCTAPATADLARRLLHPLLAAGAMPLTIDTLQLIVIALFQGGTVIPVRAGSSAVAASERVRRSRAPPARGAVGVRPGGPEVGGRRLEPVGEDQLVRGLAGRRLRPASSS